MFSQYSIQNAILTMQEADNSGAGKAAREKAKNHLRAWANQLRWFASLRPSRVADICNQRAAEFMALVGE